MISTLIHLAIASAFAKAASFPAFAARPSSSSRSISGRSHPPRASAATTIQEEESSPPKDLLRVGFVGCGTIARAIASGLLDHDAGSRVVGPVSVSRRSEANSAQLKEAHPSRVAVCDDNQDVVDASDVVFVCVLPQQMEKVLSGLEFREDQTLVSLVSTSNLPDLRKISGLPEDRVFKMTCKFSADVINQRSRGFDFQMRGHLRSVYYLPLYLLILPCLRILPQGLPRVSEADHTSLIVPKGSPKIKAILESLGGCVECEDEDIMRKLMVTTSLMGPLYGIMRQNAEWLVKHGVNTLDANRFVSGTYLSIVQDAEARCKEEGIFNDLVNEQTPGGLNEQV